MRLAAILAFPLLLDACSLPAGERPGKGETVALTHQGIAELFERECIQQRSTVWARQKYRNIVDGSCWPEYGSCVTRLEPSLAWDVPATTGRGSVRVTLDWERPFEVEMGPPGKGPMSCSIAVPDGHEALLRGLVMRIRSKGRPLVELGGERWDYFAHRISAWEPADKTARGPVVALLHYPDEKTYAADVAAASEDGKTGPYEWALSEIRKHQSHPWKLHLVPLDEDRLQKRPCPGAAAAPACEEIPLSELGY
jgi:hypothetical protein